jgi:hypothetical protein
MDPDGTGTVLIDDECAPLTGWFYGISIIVVKPRQRETSRVETFSIRVLLNAQFVLWCNGRLNAFGIGQWV